MSRHPLVASLFAAALLAGCATDPMGPTARVMPSPGKPFEAFAQDQSMCKQFADGEVGGGASLSNVKQLGAAAVSTVLGAGLGAALHHARGGQVGGALGSIVGAASGARGSGRDQNALQGRYDLAYTQCMYSRGNQIAGVARGGTAQGYGVASAGPGAAIAAPGYAPGGYGQASTFAPLGRW